MPEVSGLSRRAGSSDKRLRRWMQDTACRGDHKDVLPVEHVGREHWTGDVTAENDPGRSLTRPTVHTAG